MKMNSECLNCAQSVGDKCLNCVQAQEKQTIQVQPTSSDQSRINVVKKDKKVNTDKNHIKKIKLPNGGFQYNCSCGKTFNSRSQQYYHLGCADFSTGKYKCDICEKNFASRSHLKYHLETHNVQSYNCSECSKTFSNRIVLAKHLKLHKACPVKCNVCSKLFRNKESLAGHMKLHTDHFPFQCSICDKKYAINSALQQHMFKHLNKKFVCHCGKRFQRNSTLNKHLKQHSKTETYLCEICFKRFTDVGSLSRHAKIHEDGIKYKCRHCEMLTIRKDNMIRHVRNMHVGEEFNDCIVIINAIQSTQTETISNSPFSSNKLQIDDPLTNLPKTVENSSVIKCVGNVVPVKIPNDNPLLLSTHEDQAEMTYTTLKNVNLSIEEPTKENHKYLKKKYDQIERYRKILYPDDEDDENYNSVDDDLTPTQNFNVEKQKSESIHRVNSSIFSEMHWRKKYQEEYQDY